MEQITGALQENLLTLLCFDNEAAPLIKHTIEVGLYSSDIFREIAHEAVTFHDIYGTVIAEHLPDVFEDAIYGADKRKAKVYQQILSSLYNTKDSINKEYVLSRLGAFVRQQSISKAITDAAKSVRLGDLDKAETILHDGLKTKELGLQSPGLFLSESPVKILEHLRTPAEFITTGVEALDTIAFGPARKTLLTILAPTSRGKTWCMIHMGKRALLENKKVLHISLEMSEERIMTRYYQSIFSISRRKSRNTIPELEMDKKGSVIGLSTFKQISPTFKSPDLSKLIKKAIPNILNRYQLLVKQFPTGSLTMKGLEAYLEFIEREYNFIPDVLLLDYADLMQLDSSQLRIETGLIFKSIRGLMVERNIAGVTASQSNRASEDVKMVTLKHLAEDYSKAATSDMVLALCQIEQEKKRGLMRLFVAKNRDEEDGVTVLCSQGLPFGQFILQSGRVFPKFQKSYWQDMDSDSTSNPTNKRAGGY